MHRRTHIWCVLLIAGISRQHLWRCDVDIAYVAFRRGYIDVIYFIVRFNGILCFRVRRIQIFRQIETKNNLSDVSSTVDHFFLGVSREISNSKGFIFRVNFF